MIVLNLKCENCQNEFEGWFSSSKSCDEQIKKGFVECTRCASSKIQRGTSSRFVFLMPPSCLPLVSILSPDIWPHGWGLLGFL